MALAESLKHNVALRSFTFVGDSRGDESGVAFAEAVKQNPAFRTNARAPTGGRTRTTS